MRRPRSVRALGALAACVLLSGCAPAAAPGPAPCTPCEQRAPAGLAAQATEPLPRSSKLEALARKRIDLLKQSLEVASTQYKRGQASLEELMRGQREIALAAREGLRGDKRRQELAAYRDATLESNAAMKRRYTMGSVTEGDVHRAEAALAEAEYWLTEATDAP